jgi:transposase
MRLPVKEGARMIMCKHCGTRNAVKHGQARGKQRYRCKRCHRHFVEGDERVKASLGVKKALAVVLYSLSKTSFGMLGKIFGVSRSLTYRWIREEAEALPNPVVPGDIKEMEFDEMWHFIGSKKTSSGSSRRWIVAQGELWPGLQAVVILRRSGGSTTRSRI